MPLPDGTLTVGEQLTDIRLQISTIVTRLSSIELQMARYSPAEIQRFRDEWDEIRDFVQNARSVETYRGRLARRNIALAGALGACGGLAIAVAKLIWPHLGP